MQRTPLALALSALMATTVWACDDDDAATLPADDTGTVPTGSNARTLSMSFTALPALGADYVYEGWLITPSGPVSSGRFTLDANGAPTPATFDIPVDVADASTAFVLTIEPAVGDVPAPAATHVVSGPISGGTATLSSADADSLGTDFSTAAGTFFLATPTTAATNDDQYGIWFLDAAGPAASLTLPTLPAGWAYEGWVVDVSDPAAPMPISTGTFTNPAMADSDGGGPGAGTEPAPPFPGSDFVVGTMRDLSANHMAVISVEPVPDDSPAPFALKPLSVMIQNQLGGNNPQTLMQNSAESVITASIKLK